MTLNHPVSYRGMLLLPVGTRFLVPPFRTSLQRSGTVSYAVFVQVSANNKPMFLNSMFIASKSEARTAGDAPFHPKHL